MRLKLVPIRTKNARNVQSQDIHGPSANRVLRSVQTAKAHTAMDCPVKKKALEVKKIKLRTEKDKITGRSYAGVASAAFRSDN